MRPLRGPPAPEVLRLSGRVNRRRLQRRGVRREGCIGCATCFYNCPSLTHCRWTTEGPAMRRFVKGIEAGGHRAVYADATPISAIRSPPRPAIIAHAPGGVLSATGQEHLQAECETGAINRIFVRRLGREAQRTASSGPDNPDAGRTVIPGRCAASAGVVNSADGGPGLGNLGPEQGDYNQAVGRAGTATNHNIVRAPASVQLWRPLPSSLRAGLQVRNAAICWRCRSRTDDGVPELLRRGRSS